MAEWVKNSNITTCCLQEAHFKFNDIGRLKTKRWKQIHHANINKIGFPLCAANVAPNLSRISHPQFPSPFLTLGKDSDW